MGANYQFETVYAHPRDFEMIRFFSTPEQQKQMVKNMVGGAVVPAEEVFKDTSTLTPVVLKPIKDGYVYHLGGRNLEVIEVPGHTPGSICLLDKKNKILFSGDNDNTLVWLHIQGCMPLETYLKSLEKLNARVREFTILMPGHGIPIESSFVGEQIICVQNILSGACQGEPYKSFADDGKKCTYKRPVWLIIQKISVR